MSVTDVIQYQYRKKVGEILFRAAGLAPVTATQLDGNRSEVTFDHGDGRVTKAVVPLDAAAFLVSAAADVAYLMQLNLAQWDVADMLIEDPKAKLKYDEYVDRRVAVVDTDPDDRKKPPIALPKGKA